jgi:hypothetical protein
MIANIEPTATKASAPLYYLKVVLNATKPIIWRRLQVPGNANLGWMAPHDGGATAQSAYDAG